MESSNNASVADQFIVEDLLNFPNDDDDAVITDATFNSVTTDSSSVTAVESCNSSSFSGCGPNSLVADAHFSGDLCVPDDDLAELEWLSNLVEESFSSEDLQKMQIITGMKARNNDHESSETRGSHSEPNRTSPIFDAEVCVPAKARSKRTRGPPCNWASRLLVLSSPPSYSDPDAAAVISTPIPPPHSLKKPTKAAAPRRKDSSGDGGSGDGRRCLHCATDKTPQWRTGPMGPKTLCNACGVRYKSGRLVPEYRPAASPTFVLTKHSNSHRKVMELRRQKEMVRAQQQQPFLPNMIFEMPTNGDDFLIHQHMGPDFRQLI